MEPGILNWHCSIQTNTPTPDGDVWAEARKQWLSVIPLSANKIVFLSAQGSRVTHQIIAREKPALVVGQRAVYDGVNYQIVEVQTFRGDRQEALAEVVE